MTRLIKYGVLVLLSGWLMVGLAEAQSFAAGARSLGVGGAYQALADDATAIFWNPAGTATLGKQLHGTIGSYSRIDEDGNKDAEPVPGPAFAGGVYDIDGQSAIMGAYFSPFVNDRRFELTTNLPPGQRFQDIMVEQFLNRLSLGYARQFRRTEDGGYFTAIAFGGTLDLSITSIEGFYFDSTGRRDTLNKREVAAGFSFGVLAVLVDNPKFELKIGATYHHSGDFRLRNEGFKPFGESSQGSRLYDWPLIAGGGVAVRCLESKTLVFVADYQFIRWSKANRNLRDAHNVSVGTEYAYFYREDFQIIFRLGARRLEEATHKDPFSQGIEDHATNGTAGVGLVYEPRTDAFYALDFAAEFGDTFNFSLSLTLGF